VGVDRTEVRESWQPRLGPVQRDKGFAVTLGEAGELSMRGTGAGGTDAVGNWNGANLGRAGGGGTLSRGCGGGGWFEWGMAEKGGRVAEGVGRVLDRPCGANYNRCTRVLAAPGGVAGWRSVATSAPGRRECLVRPLALEDWSCFRTGHDATGLVWLKDCWGRLDGSGWRWLVGSLRRHLAGEHGSGRGSAVLSGMSEFGEVGEA
jgi:hypothetical protein